MKKILIVGANFINKGAQSMLFVCYDEIQKKFPNSEIYFATSINYEENNYNLKSFFYSEDSKKLALSNNIFSFSFLFLKSFTKDLIKLFLGKKDNLFKFMYVKKNYKSIDIVIDISGYNIGDKWSDDIQLSYIRNIMLAKKFDKEMYLMPQSFGPFNSYTKRKKLFKQLDEFLKYPKIIFVREKEGFDCLKKQFSLQNIRQSTDLVLQNNGIMLSKLFKKNIDLKIPAIKENSVAIIPNKQCYNYGNYESVEDLYTSIIDHLVNMKKNVYIISHSLDDRKVCSSIYKKFEKLENVILLKEDFSCLEYDKLTNNFDFIICSRYHGIVHAYRNYIPCIILGWAVKYDELANNVSQSKYCFNIVDRKINQEDIFKKIEDMNSNLMYNKKTIKSEVNKIRKNNCFTEVFNEIEKEK